MGDKYKYTFARRHEGEWRGQRFTFKTVYKPGTVFWERECAAWAAIQLGVPCVSAKELKIDGKPLR